MIDRLQAKIDDPTTPADLIKTFKERLNMMKKTVQSGKKYCSTAQHQRFSTAAYIFLTIFLCFI